MQTFRREVLPHVQARKVSYVNLYCVYGVTPYKIVIVTVTTLRTWNLAFNFIHFCWIPYGQDGQAI